jgi:hypothetical protein
MKPNQQPTNFSFDISRKEKKNNYLKIINLPFVKIIRGKRILKNHDLS